MQRSANLVQNSTFGPFKLPKGAGACVAIVTDTTNNAGAIVELDVSGDDGTTFLPVAITDLQSVAATPRVANLTGPNKIGQIYLDGAQDCIVQAKRTDAVGGVCIVWVGITTTAID